MVSHKILKLMCGLPTDQFDCVSSRYYGPFFVSPKHVHVYYFTTVLLLWLAKYAYKIGAASFSQKTGKICMLTCLDDICQRSNCVTQTFILGMKPFLVYLFTQYLLVSVTKYIISSCVKGKLGSVQGCRTRKAVRSVFLLLTRAVYGSFKLFSRYML